MDRKEFRCVVLGDEPAALWLLERLATLSAQRGEPMSLAWVSLGRADQRLCVPTGFLERFSLPIAQSWSAELVTGHRSFSWDPQTLRERFPELPYVESDAEMLALLLQPHERIRKACRSAVERHPDLFTYAKAVWKRVGRTSRLAPEQFVIGSLLCRRLSWWTPQGVGFAGDHIAIDPRTQPVEAIQFERDGAVTIRFVDQAPVLGHQWILASSIYDLELLSRKNPQLMDIAFPAADFDARSVQALYPFKMKVAANAVPVAMRPLTLSFESAHLPDIDSEVWPIEAPYASHGASERDLTVWTSAFHGLDLENVLDSFRKALEHTSRVLPYAQDLLRSFSVPLDMETCATDVHRDGILRQLESERCERYDLTRFHTQTRLRNIHALLPNLFCHLPYPVGPFIAAEQLLPQILGKPKKKSPTVGSPDVRARA